jgi:hypothetical protein
MIGKTVRTAMINDSAINALVAERIYPLVYPSGATFPCVTYRVISGYQEPVTTEQVNTTRVQLDVWSYEYLDTAEIKSEIMRLFNHYDAVVDGQRIIHAKVDLAFDTFEQNVKMHRAVVDLRIIHEDD